MELTFDSATLAMCQAYVNQEDEDNGSVVTEVKTDGINVHIEYKFPCTMGWKYAEWHTTVLELIAFVWSQQP